MKAYTLHARQKKLLYLLNCRHGMITGRELSAKMGVSERTIRNDIVDINRIMDINNIRIQAVHGKGYFLQVEDRTILHELFSEKDNIQTREDRIKYLLVNLVYSNDWVDIRELEDDMFVSRTTLENDLKDIRNLISENQPFLPLLRNGNFILLEDNEIKRRNILIRVYSENWDYNSQDGIFLKENVVNQELLNQIRHTLKRILKECEIDLDDFGMIYLMLAFAISYSRITEGHELQSFQSRFQNPDIKQMAQKMWDSLQQLWEITINQNEYLWMAETLEKLSILNLHIMTEEDVQKRIELQCTELVNSLICEIRKNYGFDFSEDETFYLRMLIHIQAIRNSMLSGHTQNQYIIEEMRLQYPVMGDVSHYICTRIQDFCGRKMGDEEEDYLLPVLTSARNRLLLRKSEQKIRAAVVSHLNTGLTDFLLDQLKEKYGATMEFIGPFPIYDRSKIDETKPSFVITTVKMDIFRKFDIPVITVSPLLDEDNQNKIEQCRKNIEEGYLTPKLPLTQVDYFRKELLVQLERKISVKEAINILEENLRSNLYLDEEIQLDWAKSYCSSMQNGILFVYAIGNEAQKTVLSIAECKHMLTWKQTRNIQKVVMLILNSKERSYIGSFYRMIQEYAEATASE
jgi:transcriptional antiterminator